MIAQDWFASKGWTPFPFQLEVWQAYLAGESGLVHAATGTGKTLAVWWGPLLEWIAEHGLPTERVPNERRKTPPLRVVWLTPLRALAGDTRDALSLPLNELGLPWSLELRTSDSSAALKARQSRRLPTVLITTPESLSLLLTREDAAEQFGSLRAVVVDEWHELMGTKRGVQVELALARLRRFRPALRVWGLSATIGNLEQAKTTLLGTAERRVPSRIVRGVESKSVVVDALIPTAAERFPWAGHLNTVMLPEVVKAIDEGATAIVFTNTRSQAEIWYQALLEARPDWAGLLAVHHGSLDRKRRDWVENALRDGRIRCVVATSSLDLGVDFSPVDRVLQVGSPKGIARLLQRAGRSGHKPGAVSRVTCVPTNALELIDVAAAREGIATAALESRQPVERPLDVLAQHMVTVALGGGFTSQELLAEVRETRAYAALEDAEWEWVLDFVSRGGAALRAYPEYNRIILRDGRYVVERHDIARRHRLSIGTIVGDAQIGVHYMRGRSLGSVEESFVARLRPGDRFIFAGTPLEFVRVRDMKAWVRRAPSVQGAVPRWSGVRMAMSENLSQMVRRKMDEAARGMFCGAEMESVRSLLELQAKWSRIPAMNELLIERVHTREGWHLFFYPFAGRLVHEGLSALFAYRLSRRRPISFSFACNDYGFELLSADEPPLEAALADGLLNVGNLLDDIPASLNATEMARRQFRELARVAGLVFPGFPRSGKTAKQLQASSGLLFDVFLRYDPENRLLSQAQREVLERQLEHSRMGRTLERLNSAEVCLTQPPRVTPFAFPLVVDRTRERVSTESLVDRITKMRLQLEKAAG
ncbi:MAG TPA: ligase-associated DNA damage response DEXH box helicase [Gemmatimonadaceae bacterium]|nr:ligase-associated DNA damage response DEXH box helicase [Gemmatimonadaceae bacterium]